MYIFNYSNIMILKQICCPSLFIQNCTTHVIFQTVKPEVRDTNLLFIIVPPECRKTRVPFLIVYSEFRNTNLLFLIVNTDSLNRKVPISIINPEFRDANILCLIVNTESLYYSSSLTQNFIIRIYYFSNTIQDLLTLTVLVTTIDAQWEGMGDVGSERYEPALLPPCPTIRVLSYSNY